MRGGQAEGHFESDQRRIYVKVDLKKVRRLRSQIAESTLELANETGVRLYCKLCGEQDTTFCAILVNNEALCLDCEQELRRRATGGDE